MDYTVHGILQARILEWVAVPFSRGSSQPRDWTQVSLIAGGFFTSWATREALRLRSLLGRLLVSQIFLVSDDLDNFEEFWSGILYNGLQCFLMIRLGRGAQNYNSHHIMQAKRTINMMMLLMWTLITWLRQSSFSTINLLCFPPFLNLILWQEDAMYSSHLRSGYLCSTFMKGNISLNYWEFCMTRFVYSPTIYNLCGCVHRFTVGIIIIL